ncbi:MAG: putative substrate-binding transport protein [Schumannella sp.]|nr:putative substrate-binding transport protein [Schumannella sp.]
MSRAWVAAAGAAALLLAGCSAASPASTPTRAPASLTGTVTVFAAASLTTTFDLLAAKFEKAHPGVDVVLDYGGSSGLATQILQGAPADVFAAASESSIAALTDSGDVAHPVIFTTNTLEIAVPPGNPAGIRGLADLADPSRTIALCDPAVPCGAAAETLMHQAGYQPAPDTLEQDVRSVLTKVELGEADAGLVYVTDVIAAGDDVDGVAIPEAGDVVSRYPIAALTHAPNPDAAKAWVDFVLSDVGQGVLAAAGFVAP